MDARASGDRIIAVDLGKTSLRAALFVAGAAVDEVRADGAPGLGLERSAETTFALLHEVLKPLTTEGVTHIGVGVAGALAASDEAALLAARLADDLQVPTAVTSDLIAAHVGAFAGGPGVLLIAGTGAVALGVDVDGEERRADGWGPDIGDLGGGSWIGRELVRAVLNSREQGAPNTVLDRMVAATIPGSREPIRWIAEGANPARRLAALAPVAIDAADAGDAVAADIVVRAARHLTQTAIRAGGAGLPVATIGGLAEAPSFRQALAEAFTEASVHTAVPRGTPVDGALVFATRTGLPHERHIHRAG